MKSYEIPPNNSLFSRRWIHRDKMTHTDIIDRTNRKLEDLEQRLQKIEGVYTKEQQKILSTIRFLKRHIGIWETYPKKNSFWNSSMVYPSKLELTSWDSDILGPFTSCHPTGSFVCVVMLSDEGVNWLNAVVHWLEKSEGSSV